MQYKPTVSHFGMTALSEKPTFLTSFLGSSSGTEPENTNICNKHMYGFNILHIVNSHRKRQRF